MIDKIIKILNDKGVRGSAFRGGAILGLGGTLEHLARLARNVILARLLAPESFGVMAIVLSIGGLLESFTEVGVRYAVVQNPRGGESAYLNAAWWFSFFRGCCLYCVAFLLAPFIAEFYSAPELKSLIRVSCLSILFNAGLNVALIAKMKNMEFKSWALACNGGSLVALTATILLAFRMPTVWVLVFGTVADSAMRCILSYIVCPFAPRFRIDREEIKALYRFSRGFAGLPILYAVSRSADVFVLGKIVAASLVGVYSLSSSLARTPLDFFKGIVGQVTMPLLSSVQDDKLKQQTAICQGVSLLASCLFPAATFVWIYGGSLLEILYGRQYAAANFPLAVLFTAGVIEITTIPIATLYFAIGQPKLHRMFTMIRAAVLLVLIVPACMLFGWNGAASSVFLASLIGYVFQSRKICTMIGIKISELGKTILLPLMCAIAPLPVWLLGEKLIPVSVTMRGILACIGLLLAYSLVIFFQFLRRRIPQAVSV